jgi:hypothetical protein
MMPIYFSQLIPQALGTVTSGGGEDPGGGTPDPPPVGGFTHGIQVSATNVGPTTSNLTNVGDVTTTSNGQIIQNIRCTSLTIRHNCTVRNVEVLPPYTVSGAGYSVRHNQTATHAKFENCRIWCRDATSKGFVSNTSGATSDWFQCVFHGGEDNTLIKGTGLSAATGYGHRFIECWFGDIQRVGASHSDTIQIDGGPYGVAVIRCRVDCFNVPVGSDPYVSAPATISNEFRGGGAFIATYGANPVQIGNTLLQDSYFNGGNNCVDLDPPEMDGPTPSKVINNKWGRFIQFNAIVLSPGTNEAHGNVFADNNQPVPGGNLS